ncbi:Adenylate kinase domain-containing protein [Phytophthora infestans]|uniref:Adenylate kinase domain-containing protein n=1 Tax=Phytophthora infestans TaxID=4787 RepID=A0A833X0P5_PHYIN|nr:Adenylate kinase domain-containing protein [Phytophthora infestans]
MDHAELYAIRRSEHGDQNGVLELDSPTKEARRSYFGRALLGAVIETSFLALTATDPTRPERVLGFAAFDSSPPGELNAAACYSAFLEHKFELPQASSFLFLTYFAQRQATVGAATRPPVLKHLLHAMFATLVNKRSVLLVLPEDVNVTETEPALAKFFERVATRSTSVEVKNKRLEQQFAKNAKTFSKFTVYQAKVDAFFPSVHVRRARVEDHDDLQPILTAQAESVTSAFGDYFLAELIHDQDEHNVCLIAEAATIGQGRAVGLLAISNQIDVSTLQDNFALSALNDLAKGNITALNSDKITPPRLVIAGPPAGGKGTQCELLVEAFNVLHLSTGDLLRAAVACGSTLGVQAQHFMDSGQLVPDELIVDVVLERLGQPDCDSRGWLLDGFPRTATQAQALLAAGFCPDAVIALDVPDDEVVRRIAGRRVDPETGKTYHLEFNPPPQDEDVLARLIQRSDDTETTIRQRLATFHKHLGSVLAAFTVPDSEAKVITVNGLQSKHAVAQLISEQTRTIKTAQKLRYLINRGEMTPPKLVISGPPAGGKGTQCEQLVALLNVVHLSTGDMLRQAIREQSPLGMQAQGFMDGGQLVPDELIVDVVLERITQPDCESRGWLLDGFPRTATQAEALLAARGGKAAPDCVLVLDVPDEEVIRRIAGRRVDPETGKTYHVEFNPPPLEVQARVIQRSDDTEETLRTRLEQFHAHSDGVLAAFEAYHGENGAPVQIIRADGLQPASLIAKAFVAPIIQRGADVEARVLQRTGAENLSKLARAEAHSNCFAITLFCVGDDAFERSSSADLLVAAFATFPTRDYCLLTLPTHAREPPCLAFFSRITARPASAFTHALYVLHRDAISFFCPQTSDGRGVLQSVQIDVQRLLSSAENAALTPLMAGLNRQTRRALDQELDAANEEAEIDLEDSPRHTAFIVRANGQVVGLAALARQPEVATLLPHHFDIDRVARMEFHRAKDLAFVRHLILNPIFASCSRVILLELMRLFRKTCLVYQVPTGLGTSTSNLTSTTFSAALEEFVLAPPRRGAHANARKTLLPATKDTEEVSDDVKDERERVRRAAVCAAFALFVLPKRLLSEPKMTVNQRVVFVGASDAALSCLARLLATPYLYFSNLTLISPHGLTVATMDESDDDTLTPRASDFAKKSLFTAIELEQFSLRTHVRVIESRMVRLDRETRAVILQDGSCIPYDYLALTTGLQDGTCTSLKKPPRFIDEGFGDGTTTAAMYSPPVIPRQMMILGDVPTAQKLHTVLSTKEATTGGSIVVYGSSLLALQVIQALLIRGINGSRIHHVSSSRDNGSGVFEDIVVRSEMDKQYANSGVTLHTATKIVAIETKSGNDDELEGVRVLALEGSKNPGDDSIADGELIPCSWLLCCQHNDSDADVFRAINESGLVYDGRLVVDGHMRTTDAHVLGAGPLCRFSRRFMSAKLHEHYSSREGGELLAKSLLQLLDPMATQEPSEVHPLPTQPSKTWMVPPPDMELPVVQSAVVLGGKFYVQISIPTLTNTLALQSLPTNTASRTTDVNLIDTDTHAPSRPTSGATKPSRYTCLLFDDVGVLNRLEYLGDVPVPVRDLQNLVGLHEAYLNSALASYSAGKVHDWVSFFADPWANALYHDRFPAFRTKLRTLLAKDDGVRAIADDAVAFMRETGDTKGAMALAQERVGRGGSSLEPSTRRLVESQVLEFLGNNRDVLNMFLLPKGGAPTRPGSK